jgi:hypothetical protein
LWRLLLPEASDEEEGRADVKIILTARKKVSIQAWEKSRL